MSFLERLLRVDDQPCLHVLVVGATYAGMSAADTLLRSRAPLAVTLISPDLEFEFVPSSLRSFLLPHPINSVASPLLGRTFGFVHGTVISLARNVAQVHMVRRRHRKTAFLDCPRSYIEFNYCIWAVAEPYPDLPDRFPSFFFYGDSYTAPLTAQTKIATAGSILVIGGGVAGVETAAELAVGLPPNMGPRITLATTNTLLPRLPQQAQHYALEWLQAAGVEVVRARVSQSGSSPSHRNECDGGGARVFECESGPETLCADLAIRCTRARTSRSLHYADSSTPSTPTMTRNGGGWQALAAGGVCADQDITKRGAVEVRGTLQLRRSANILVAGDVALAPGELDIKSAFGEKTLYAAMAAGRLAARNVCALDAAARRGERQPVLELYPEHAFPLGVFPRLFAVSLHESDGCLCVGPLVVTGRVAVFTKRVSALLGAAATSGIRPLELLFAVCSRSIFFFAAVVQAIFGRTPSNDLNSS